MKAALFKEKNSPLRVEEVAKPIPVKGQVLVKLHAAALNHRDLWIQNEQAIPSASGIILGSDGSGIIDSVGEAVDEIKYFPLLRSMMPLPEWKQAASLGRSF